MLFFICSDSGMTGADVRVGNYRYLLNQQTLNRFDNAIGKMKWAGKEYGYPVHSSNGCYLTSDD